MSDYIKREDAINELCNNCNVGIIEYGECRYMFNGECKEARGIKDLPSADVVERKSGEWLECGIDCILSEEGDYENIVTMYVCSECDSDYLERSNFCPNCGADMRAYRKE